MARTYWWSRTMDGRVQFKVRPDEASLLLQVLTELRVALEGPEDNPVLQRLFPRAYLDPTEDEAERTFQVLAHSSLLRTRLDTLTELTDTLERATRERKQYTITLDDEDIGRWMGALNDARLALGVVAGITDDLEPDDLDPDDPRRLPLEVYSLVTWCFGELVDVQLATLPEDGLE